MKPRNGNRASPSVPIITCTLLVMLMSGVERARAQEIEVEKWVLVDVQINPRDVLPEWSRDVDLTIDGRSVAGIQYETIEVSTISYSYSERREDLSGYVQSRWEYTCDFTPPPAELIVDEYGIANWETVVSGDLTGVRICDTAARGSCEVVDGALTGVEHCYEEDNCFYFSGLCKMYTRFGTGAPSFDNLISGLQQEYLELSMRAGFSNTMTVRKGPPQVSITEDYFYVVWFGSGYTHETESGEDEEVIVAWFYQPVPKEADDIPTDTADDSSDPSSDSDDARTSRKEATEELIQNDIKGYVDDLKEMLAKETSGDDAWVTPLPEQPTDYIENPIIDDVAPASPEFPDLSWDEVVEQLSDRVKSPAGVNEESMDALFELIRGLLWTMDEETERFTRQRRTGYDLIDIHLNDGTSVRVGVMVTPEGRILYTADGKDYSPDLEMTILPSAWQQTTAFLSDTTDWAWSAAFEGSTGNRDTDLKNKVAAEVMDDLRTQLAAGEAPKSVGDWVEGKLWDTAIKGPVETGTHQWLWQKAEEALNAQIASGDLIPTPEELEQIRLFKDLKHQFDAGGTTTPKAWTEFRSQTGLDLFDLTQAGQTAVAGGEFAVESIKTMGRALQDTDFAVRVRAYIEEREAGSDIQRIWDNMKDHQLPELDIGAGKAVSGGVSSVMAASNVEQEARLGVMFTMYEQAYQRYLLAKEMGRQP